MQLAVNLPTKTSAGPANHAAEAAGSAYDSQMVNDENHLATNMINFNTDLYKSYSNARAELPKKKSIRRD